MKTKQSKYRMQEQSQGSRKEDKNNYRKKMRVAGGLSNKQSKYRS